MPKLQKRKLVKTPTFLLCENFLYIFAVWNTIEGIKWPFGGAGTDQLPFLITCTQIIAAEFGELRPSGDVRGWERSLYTNQHSSKKFGGQMIDLTAQSAGMADRHLFISISEVIRAQNVK